jgi:hypothetical protein
MNESIKEEQKKTPPHNNNELFNLPDENERDNVTNIQMPQPNIPEQPDLLGNHIGLNNLGMSIPGGIQNCSQITQLLFAQMLQPNQQQPLPGPDTVNTQILMMLMGIAQQQDRLQQHQDLAALYLVQALRSHQAGSAMSNQLLQRQEQEQHMNHLFFGLGNGNANLGGLFSNTWPSAAALPPPAGIMGLQGLLSNPLLGNTFPSAVFALSHTQGAAMGQASGVAGGLLSNLRPLLNHNHVIASATQPVQGAADAPARCSDHDTF